MASETQGYNDYTQQHRFSHDSGVIVLPTAGRTPGHKRIRLHGGMGTRVVRWTAERTGKPPVMPAAVDTLGDKILSSSIVCHLPLPGTEAFTFRSEGEYTFVQNEPRIVGANSFPTGMHPYPLSPMDVEGTAAVGIGPASPPDTMEAFDDEVDILFHAVAGEDGVGSYTWPFTVVPNFFAAQTIV